MFGVVLLFASLLLVDSAHANAAGAPPLACTYNTANKWLLTSSMCSVEPNSVEWRFKFPSAYTPGSTYNITMDGAMPFKGLLLRASAGVLTNPQPGTLFKTLMCSDTTISAITHANANAKMAAQFIVSWIAPAAGGSVVLGGMIVGSRTSLTECTYGAQELTINVATPAPTPMPPAPVTFTFNSPPLAPRRASSTATGAECGWTNVDAAAVASSDGSAISSSCVGVGKTAPLYLSDFGLNVTADGLTLSGLTATIGRSATGGAACVDETVGLALGLRVPASSANLASGAAWPATPSNAVYGNASFVWALASADAASDNVGLAAFGLALTAQSTGNGTTCAFSVNSVSVVMTLQLTLLLTSVTPAAEPSNVGGGAVEIVTDSSRGDFLNTTALVGAALVVRFGAQEARITSRTKFKLNVVAPAGPENTTVDVQVSLNNRMTWSNALKYSYGAMMSSKTSTSFVTPTPLLSPTTSLTLMASRVPTSAPTTQATAMPISTLPAIVGADYLLYHAAVMLFAWWVLNAASTFFARFLKSGDNWSIVHGVVGTLVVLLTFAGFGLGIVGAGSELKASSPHHYLGYALLFLMLFQPALGFYARYKFDVSRERVPLWPDRVHAGFAYVVWLGFIVQSFLGAIERQRVSSTDAGAMLAALAGTVVALGVVFVTAQINGGRAVLDASRTFAANANAKAMGSDAAERPRGLLCGWFVVLVAATTIGCAAACASIALPVVGATGANVSPWAPGGAALGICVLIAGLLIFFTYRRQKSDALDPAALSIYSSRNDSAALVAPPPLYAPQQLGVGNQGNQANSGQFDYQTAAGPDTFGGGMASGVYNNNNNSNNNNNDAAPPNFASLRGNNMNMNNVPTMRSNTFAPTIVPPPLSEPPPSFQPPPWNSNESSRYGDNNNNNSDFVNNGVSSIMSPPPLASGPMYAGTGAINATMLDAPSNPIPPAPVRNVSDCAPSLTDRKLQPMPGMPPRAALPPPMTFAPPPAAFGAPPPGVGLPPPIGDVTVEWEVSDGE